MHFAEVNVKYKRARNNLADDGPADAGAFELVLRMRPLIWLEQLRGFADALHETSARSHHATHFDARVLAAPRTREALPIRLSMGLGQQAGIAGCRKWRGDIEIGALLRGRLAVRHALAPKPLTAAGGAGRPFRDRGRALPFKRYCIKRMR